MGARCAPWHATRLQMLFCIAPPDLDAHHCGELLRNCAEGLVTSLVHEGAKSALPLVHCLLVWGERSVGSRRRLQDNLPYDFGASCDVCSPSPPSAPLCRWSLGLGGARASAHRLPLPLLEAPCGLQNPILS
eukprot:5914672-Pyramimonas_sp.AAC.1